MRHYYLYVLLAAVFSVALGIATYYVGFKILLYAITEIARAIKGA